MDFHLPSVSTASFHGVTYCETASVSRSNSKAEAATMFLLLPSKGSFFLILFRGFFFSLLLLLLLLSFYFVFIYLFMYIKRHKFHRLASSVLDVILKRNYELP